MLQMVLNNLFPAVTAGAVKQNSPYIPQFDSLDDRIVPAAIRRPTVVHAVQLRTDLPYGVPADAARYSVRSTNDGAALRGLGFWTTPANTVAKLMRGGQLLGTDSGADGRFDFSFRKIDVSRRAAHLSLVIMANEPQDGMQIVVRLESLTGRRVTPARIGQTFVYRVSHSAPPAPPAVPPQQPQPVPPKRADLHVTKTVSAASVPVGSPVTFTVQVRNDGPDAAADVTVGDQVPYGFSGQSLQVSHGAYNAVTGLWTIGTLDDGETATLTFTGTITDDVSVINTATAASSTGDPDASDNSASAGVTGTPLPPPPPADQPLSATGLFYPVERTGPGQAVADINIGIGPATLQRLVVTLGTGFWSQASNLRLTVAGALPADPRLGTTYAVDVTGTILTIDGIGFPIAGPSESFRLTADADGVPLQVTSVRAYA